MLFTSLTFAVFFALTLALFYGLPLPGQRAVLLCANYIFYMWVKPVFALLLLAGTAVTWLTGRAIQHRALGRRRLWTVLGVGWMLGQLLLFKYADFFLTGLGLLLQWDHTPSLGLALPIGISFYSFAAAGYLFDVERGRLDAEESFVTLALFLSFFPCILSGPIPRARELLGQFCVRHLPDWAGMRRGLLRLLWGVCKKLVLADTLAIAVNAAYADPAGYTGGVWLCAAAAYSLYIYLDFSSYSDMAVGVGTMLGFTLPENFRAPYLARTVQDFWKRWHMSLTGWFREYLFFPLGGSRRGRVRTFCNILIVFAVSGLWHGAAATFVVWGLLNGAFQIAGQLTAPARRAAREKLALGEESALWIAGQRLVVFALMSAAWIFFRAESLPQAIFILKRILLILRDGPGAQSVFALGVSIRQVLVCAPVLALCVGEEIQRDRGAAFPALEKRPWLYCLLLAALAVYVALFGAYGPGFDQNEFVYFKF